MKRIILVLLAIILVVSGCTAVIDFAPISPLPTPLAIELPARIDAYQIVGDTRGVNVTCLDRDIAVMEQYPSRILIVCAGPTPTPTITLTPTLTPTVELPTVTPTPIPTLEPTPVISPTPTLIPDITDTPIPTPTATPTATQEIPSMPTVDVRVVSPGSNDGFWTETNTTFNNTAVGHEFGHKDAANGPKNVFQRFALAVPQGATITAAYLQLQARLTGSSTTVNVIISAVDEDNPAAPTTYAGAQNAARTTANVAWSNVPTFTTGLTYNSPDISTVIQEIVDRAGWASGNAIIIYVEDNGSTAISNIVRITEPFDGNAAAAPLLHVEYTEAGGAAADVVARTIEIGGQFGVMMLPTGGAGMVVIN